MSLNAAKLLLRTNFYTIRRWHLREEGVVAQLLANRTNNVIGMVNVDYSLAKQRLCQ